MAELKLLGIETSSPIFSVAVSSGGRVCSFQQANGQGLPSLWLTEQIRQVLEEAGLDLADLDSLAVSIGPGSFTGLRIGVMTAKAIAWALKKPVISVSSLEVAAQNLHERSGNLLSFVDARKEKVYSALFSADGNFPVQRRTPDRLTPPEEALRGLARQVPAGLEGQAMVVVGDGLRRYEGLVRSVLGDAARLAEPSLWIPRADRLCRIAQIRWPEARLDDPHRLVPEYLYSKESDITGW